MRVLGSLLLLACTAALADQALAARISITVEK